MGIAQSVTFPAENNAVWATLVSRLAEQNFPVQLRMIDGLPAFPDEEPPTDWRELRAGTPPGIVTLHRIPSGVRVVVWGTNEPALRAAANAFLGVIADVTGGRVDRAAGPRTAAEFARSDPLPWKTG